jgi:hypothetical protein
VTEPPSAPPHPDPATETDPTEPPVDFVPTDFAVPDGLETADFRLIPLRPEHNAADYEAWMSSIDHIRATPGFAAWDWPRKEMTPADNLGDLQGHADDYAARRGFTYTVLPPGAGPVEQVLGCVYIYPSRDPAYDVSVRSWVRASAAELDVPLYRAVTVWLQELWPFTRVAYAARSGG